MECANSRPAMEYERSRFLTDNSGGSDARNRGEHLVMPRRRQNLEADWGERWHPNRRYLTTISPISIR